MSYGLVCLSTSEFSKQFKSLKPKLNFPFKSRSIYEGLSCQAKHINYEQVVAEWILNVWNCAYCYMYFWRTIIYCHCSLISLILLDTQINAYQVHSCEQTCDLLWRCFSCPNPQEVIFYRLILRNVSDFFNCSKFTWWEVSHEGNITYNQMNAT